MTQFKICFEQIGCRYTIRQGHARPTYHEALRNISFTLSDGERLGLVGVNGAGKSTLLRLLAGVLHPTSGRIRREGRPNCALLSLSNQWYPDLNGRDNAILACLMGGLRLKEAEKIWPAIAEFAELGEWLERPIRTYSTGMSARLALATALQARPNILLLDETLSVGDARFQKKAAAAVLDVVHQAQSVVLVSHDPSALSSICTRLIWLEDGHVREDGPMEGVLAAYQAWTDGNRVGQDIGRLGDA
jgi:ABC-type polysaccharide/polyol phosphate transport system, ATPase component